jgi:ankyrin repeat protein
MNSATKRATAMIQAGANVNAIGRKNQSALMIATFKDNVSLVSQLLISGMFSF